MRELPKYKSFTVDFRLQEFRKMEYGELPVFIPFESSKGKKLMSEFLATPEGKKEIKYQGN